MLCPKQNNLDYAHSAYLYRYLQEHREEYIDLYAGYRQQMEQFVIEQIQKEHISRDLAYLYRELLTEDMIGEQTARQLGRLIFAHEIRLSHPGIRRVVEPMTTGMLELSVLPSPSSPLVFRPQA